MNIESDTLPANEDIDLKMSNPSWADAMSKILKTKKKKGKSLTLSKAKIISETNLNKIKQEKEDIYESFEIVDKGGQKVEVLENIGHIKEEKSVLEKIDPKIPNRIRVRSFLLNMKLLW